MKKTNIVMFWFMNDWGLYGRAYEQIAKTLASHDSINNVTCILPEIKSTNNQYFFEKIAVSKKLNIITPYWKSINKTGRFYTIRQLINRKFTPLQSVKFYLWLKGYRKSNTILWIFPVHRDLYRLTSEIPYSYLITQIVDNNSQRETTAELSNNISADYMYFSERSNLIITSSKFNYDIFNKYDNDCCLIENGVSSEFIAQPSNFPHKTKKLRPRLGYVGWITERTDLDLLNHIARKCTDCDIVIAGPDIGLLSASKVLDNSHVKYLGAIPQEDVPLLLQTFDICLIPHKITTYSQSMSPLKLYQYLASGRPIVSTSVAGTEKFTTLITLADSFDSFVDAIYATLSNDSIVKSTARINAAKKESWESRIQVMLKQISR
jgi:glycosyltransferase involved in cell wall biosynthesis